MYVGPDLLLLFVLLLLLLVRLVRFVDRLYIEAFQWLNRSLLGVVNRAPGGFNSSAVPVVHGGFPFGDPRLSET